MATPARRRSRRRTASAIVGAAALLVAMLSPASPAYAIDGLVGGQVTSSSTSSPLSGVTVVLYSDDGANVTQVASMVTAADGLYAFNNLPYTGYRLEFRGMNASPAHANEFWEDAYNIQLATTFPVTSSTPVLIDMELDRAATISGSLTGEFGVPDNGAVFLFHYVGGVYQVNFSSAVPAANGSWQATGLAPGQWAIRYTDLLPSTTNYRTHHHNQVLNQDFQNYVTVTAGSTAAVTARMTEAGPIPTSRLSGADRYATAIAVAGEFEPFDAAPATYVYVASGANYPDALSAAAVAAKREAPLLLTTPTSLPTAVANEIRRLDPENIVVAGGPGAVSNSVVTALRGLIENPNNVTRIGGANRYETSRLLVEDAFDNALTAFVATGRNFPDALAAGAAAGSLGSPVILVDGRATSADPQTVGLLDDLGVETLYIAGGTGVVSTAVVNDLAAVPDVVSVKRLGGADRYATSLAINQEVFDTATVAYLATGEGFADALAGAALAGSQSAPLYTVQRTCIPNGVHTHFRTIEVDSLVLLGGTSVLTSAVANRARC